MTRPSGIYFGPDGGNRNARKPKVYLRALLFCTSKKGRVVESMYVSLSRNKTRQNFSYWVVGSEGLARGSGLFIGQEGILADHHFLAPNDTNHFMFQAGTYKIRVLAKLFGDKKELELFSEELQITPDQATELCERGQALHFDWGPDSGRYLAQVERGPYTPPIKHIP